MIGFLKELWGSAPVWLKLLLLPMLLLVGYAGYRLTAPDPQVVARIGQLETILARPVERAVGRIGSVLYSDLRRQLRQFHKQGRYDDIAVALHASLKPTPPFAPAWQPAEKRMLALLWHARPTSLEALALTQFHQLGKSLQPQIPVVKRRDFCKDATTLEPRNDCYAGIAVSMLIANRRSGFLGSLPGLAWPVLPTTFACGVGARQLSGRKPSYHDAIDMGAPIGRPLWAMADGVVSSVGSGGSCGNLIKIDYDGGWRSLYCHMHEPSRLTKGARVRQGDVVGIVGSSGNSTGPHLHIRIHARTNGQWRLVLDPIRDLMLCR